MEYSIALEIGAKPLQIQSVCHLQNKYIATVSLLLDSLPNETQNVTLLAIPCGQNQHQIDMLPV